MADSNTAAVEQIKQRIASAQQRRTRAEVQRDAAQSLRDKSLSSMREEFGVSTVEEARALLHTMQSAVDRLLVDIQQALESAGA